MDNNDSKKNRSKRILKNQKKSDNINSIDYTH